MPVPRLSPGPCSALGAHKPTSICARGAGTPTKGRLPRKAQWETHLGVSQQKPSTLNKTRLLCQGCTNSKDSTQSKSDRQERRAGKGAEPLSHAHEFRAGSGFQALDSFPAHGLPAGTHHCPANSTETHTDGGSDQHQQLPLMFDMVR